MVLWRAHPSQVSYFSLASEVSSSSIQHYKYLKALCNLLCALGVHLSDVWLHIGRAPPNFNMYLSAISAFFVHPSIVWICFALPKRHWCFWSVTKFIFKCRFILLLDDSSWFLQSNKIGVFPFSTFVPKLPRCFPLFRVMRRFRRTPISTTALFNSFNICRVVWSGWALQIIFFEFLFKFV